MHSKHENPEARLETLREGDPRLQMPIADESIIKYWFELGLCLNGGYGDSPLTYSEVKSYSDLVADLSPFESVSLVKMSAAYASEKAQATNDINRPSPHEGKADIDAMRSGVAAAFKAMFEYHKKPSK